MRLRLRWSGGRIARKAQERTRHVYDYRVVLKRDESTRSVKLPLELYGTDEKGALGGLVLLEADIAPLQDDPVAGPTPRAMNRSRRLLSPELNVRHTDIVSSCVCFFFCTVGMIHYTQYV